jgi:hypothetical protein
MKYSILLNGVMELREDTCEALPEGATLLTDDEFTALRGTGTTSSNPVLDQINALQSQFTDTLQMRAILGDQAAVTSVQSILSQIDTLKAQL